MDIIVFYSWISDYKNTNKQLVRRAISKAIRKLEKDNDPNLKGIDIKLKESLSDAPGHQILSETQEKAIRGADIFIGDFTVTDPYNCIERMLTKCIGYKRRLNVNPNVVHEYTCFTENNGHDGAILVMDSSRGSAASNNDIIPIDLRDRRFPIEFNGCAKEVELSEDLYRALKISIPAAIKSRRNKVAPFHTWYEQEMKKSNHSPFYENERVTAVKDRIRQTDCDLRILGLSGIGKTRIVHEAFRGSTESFYRNNYLYVAYSQEEESCIKKAITGHLSAQSDNCTLCIDNCPPSFANNIQQIKNEYNAKNRIITIYNRQDQDSTNKVQDVDYIFVAIEDVSSIVDDILSGIYSQISEDKKRIIKEFSAGIPMMAVILADNIKGGHVNFVKIPNDELLGRLLDINIGSEKEILMSCSIFSHIGYRDEVADGAKFIICNRNITPMLDGHDSARMTMFKRTFDKYESREIFETQGRFFAIRPIPLALRLAEEWLAGCTGERMLNVITDITAEDSRTNSQMLTTAFASQMSHLAGNEKAKKFVSIITGNSSPFANAEVLNTKLGSRLFRSFVEVDPLAVSALLWNVFGNMSTEELLEVKEGRRNLVWTIQKLCFDKRTFNVGAKLLVKLALAENESWGNNSYNEALNLFHIYLPGTEANLESRLTIIKWIYMTYGGDTFLFKALSSALTSGYYSYTGGAEIQGTNKLEHYTPSGPEILHYWESVAEIVKQNVIKYPNKIEDISEIVSSNFSGLVRAGAYDMAIELLEFVAEHRKWDWEKMRDVLKMMFWRKGTDKYPSKVVEKMSLLKDRLTKNDILSKLHDAMHYDSGSWDEEVKKKTDLYKNIAKEYVGKEEGAELVLEQIIREPSLNPYLVFGAQIYENARVNKILYAKLANVLIRTVAEVKKYTDNTFLGFCGAANSVDFDDIFSRLYEDVPEALFPLLAVRKTPLKNCNVLFDLVQEGRAEVASFDSFCNYYNWGEMDASAVLSFYERVANLSSVGALLVLKRLKSMIYFDQEKAEYAYLLNLYKYLILNERVIVNFEDEDYMECLEVILDKYDNCDVALFVTKKMIQGFLNESYSFSSHGYHEEKVVSLLLNKYFETTWGDWASFLGAPQNYIYAYLLKYKLGYSVGGLSGGALFESDHSDALIKWCAEYPETAPKVLASYVPAYEGDKLSVLAKFLINTYGDDRSVLSELSCNLGSFSCVGSAVPVYERKKRALSEMLPHENPIVDQWLRDNIRYAENDIAKELDRDAEDLIIYR